MTNASVSSSVASSILDTSTESLERHFAVNARATWLLIEALAELVPDQTTSEVTGRIIALTSDHTAATTYLMGRARLPSTVSSSPPPSNSDPAASVPT